LYFNKTPYYAQGIDEIFVRDNKATWTLISIANDRDPTQSFLEGSNLDCKVQIQK